MFGESSPSSSPTMIVLSVLISNYEHNVVSVNVEMPASSCKEVNPAPVCSTPMLWRMWEACWAARRDSMGESTMRYGKAETRVGVEGGEELERGVSSFSFWCRVVLQQNLDRRLTSKSLYDGDWNLATDMKPVEGERGDVGEQTDGPREKKVVEECQPLS